MNNINLSIFQNKNLFEAGTEFFSQLGITLNSNTSVSLDAKEILKDRFKDTDIFNNISETYFLGLVDDSLFDKDISLIDKEKLSYEEAANKVDIEYNGIMVFGVKLPATYSPKRGEIADLTRAFNRVSKNIPIILLLQYGSQLSLAASERTRYQQAWREGEKIGKISLLKDINLRTPHTGHLKILHEMKIKSGVASFNALYQQWRDVFNVQLLNKRFYSELANWYFWAVKEVKFPDNCEKDDEDVRNAASVIRLITRLIFIWFVKEKGLIPDDLFSHDRLKGILKFTDRNNSAYYKAILQNLFFATLNTEMNKDKPGNRKFRHKAKKSGQRDQHYMIPNIFRYEDYFISPQDSLERYFENIPFLNGGLFECLDKEVVTDGIDRTIRIDGFSDRTDNLLTVPDELFFSPEQIIDLNETYGTKNKRYKVRGLIEILNSYKFTITENTPVEEEIALDPELLGKVFENLLASYNPETKTTARKQTGSYYTPREIVNYMVDESLIAYLSNQLAATENPEDKLKNLFDYNEDPHQFSEREAEILIDAIDNAKILDPACGSGAFPMGILHKLVYILGKLDPNNQKWRQKQINKVLEIPDSTVREKLLADIEQSFQSNELDYGRKLYLIENSIYGVDIQPIAVQIAKLRFFISLIVDQKVNPDKQNLGIRPLPNLETKFAAANTLIGIEKPEQMILSNPAIDEKEKELKKVRERHFTARTPKTKKKYRKEDERLRAEIAELLKKDGLPRETTEKLTHWNPYDQNASADFFDPEWMFGIRDGFDVVIGNPPYGANMDKTTITKITSIYQYYDRQKNSASFFIELAKELAKNDGVISYIVPKSLSFSEGWRKTRTLIAHVNQLHAIVDVSKAFDNVLLEQVIVLYIKRQNESYSFYTGEGWYSKVNIIDSLNNSLIRNLDILPIYANRQNQQILNKLHNGSTLLLKLSNTFRGLPLQSNISTDGFSILRGKNIGKYVISGKLDKVYLPQKYKNSEKTHNILQSKIVSQNIVAHVLNPYDRIIIMATIDKSPFLTMDTAMNTVLTVDRYTLEYILAILNSKTASWFYYWFVYNRAVRTMHFDKYYIGKIPIKEINLLAQQPFITLVNQILTAKQKDPQADTTALEKQIDVMVYKLYGLTYEEVKIVDPEFEMTEEEYNKIREITD